jgi:aconitate hydratase
MRDAVAALGSASSLIEPIVPVDLVVDHSVQVDRSGASSAFSFNLDLEFARNQERYRFLKWGEEAFKTFKVVPPGIGICHQVNLEYLARVVCAGDVAGRRMLYPDSVLGMDSHTPMINSIGVVGWGVGGLEGAAAALGEPVSMLIPPVVGCRLSGRTRPGVTATDIVLTITQALRRENLIGYFVEYLGPGVDALEAADRSTISNMTPETGATMGFFPVDAETLRFLRLTGRDEQHIALVEAYARAQGLWRDRESASPEYARYIDIDLAAIEPCVAGPWGPHQRVLLANVPATFRASYSAGTTVRGTERSRASRWPSSPPRAAWVSGSGW